MRTSLLLLVLASAAAPARAQQPSGPPPKPRYHAERATGPIQIDGRLDEDAWRVATPLRAFRQVEPQQGQDAAFETTVRIIYDDKALYAAFFARDTLGRRALRSWELKRDFESSQTDFVGLSLDAFHDTRTALFFEATPYEVQQDIQAFDGANENEDWNAVWVVRTQRTDSGWTAEYRIPWTSLRFPRDGRPWAMNVYRSARRANETSAWSPWPRNLTRLRMDFAGDLEGLEPPPPATNIRIRPYVLGTTDRTGDGPALGDASGKVGGEVSWSPSASSVLDLTYNTDFAQTDVDRQVVNLSRFSVFFPERRQFFLESAQLFSTGSANAKFIVQPFFSRRIGLDNTGAPVDIVGGARYTQRGANGALGALLIRQRGTDVQGPSNFAVVRLSENVGASSRIGAFAAVRFDEARGSAAAQQSVVGAIDALVRFSPQLRAEGSISPFRSSDGRQGLGGYAFVARETRVVTANFYAALATRDYDPPTGFVSRTNTLLLSPAISADLRPRWRPRAIRSFIPAMGTSIYLEPSNGRLQQTSTDASVLTRFQSGGGVTVYGNVQQQQLDAPLGVVPGVTVTAGRYDVVRGGVEVLTDASRWWNVVARAEVGGFYDGRLTTLSETVRIVPDRRFLLSVGYQNNRLRDVGAPGQRQTTHLFQPELRLAATARATLGVFYQYNSTAAIGALNARLSWEFAPLSYVFLVFNDRRAEGLTPPGQVAAVPSRQLVLKVSWLGQL